MSTSFTGLPCFSLPNSASFFLQLRNYGSLCWYPFLAPEQRSSPIVMCLRPSHGGVFPTFSRGWLFFPIGSFRSTADFFSTSTFFLMSHFVSHLVSVFSVPPPDFSFPFASFLFHSAREAFLPAVLYCQSIFPGRSPPPTSLLFETPFTSLPLLEPSFSIPSLERNPG